MAFIFTIWEIIDLLVMTFVIGFIFKDFIPAKALFNKPYKIHADLTKTQSEIFWKDMWTAIIIAAPAIILHEFGHKFAALAFGFDSTFHAAYVWLVVALLLKLINFSFIFIVPAFVESTCAAGAAFCAGKASFLASAMIALAGPLVNLLLWLGSYIVIKNNLLPKKYKRWEPALILTARINFFLMLFNMIPIPGFDGYHFFTGMINYFGLLHFFF